MKKKILIISKIICPAVITPMTIAEKNEFGRVVKDDFLARFKYFS
jgi:hypothetical protein